MRARDPWVLVLLGCALLGGCAKPAPKPTEVASATPVAVILPQPIETGPNMARYPVTIARDGEQLHVAGVGPRDQVITYGAGFVRDGDRVQVARQ